MLLKDVLQLSPFFGHCLSCRELIHPRSHTFTGQATFHEWLTGGYENHTPSSHLRTALNGHLRSRTLELYGKLAEALVGPASQLCFSLCSLMLPLPPLHRCWSQGHTLINIVCDKFCLRVCFPGISTCEMYVQLYSFEIAFICTWLSTTIPSFIIKFLRRETIQPWPSGLVGWCVIPYTKRLWVCSPLMYRRQLIDVSLSHRCFSLSLPLSLKSINRS